MFSYFREFIPSDDRVNPSIPGLYFQYGTITVDKIKWLIQGGVKLQMKGSMWIFLTLNCVFAHCWERCIEMKTSNEKTLCISLTGEEIIGTGAAVPKPLETLRIFYFFQIMHHKDKKPGMRPYESTFLSLQQSWISILSSSFIQKLYLNSHDSQSQQETWTRAC